MRKFLIPVAAAVATVGFAAPASAQWFPQPQGYGHGYYNTYPQPYGYAYGQRANFGQARAMKARLDIMQREIRRLASYRMISRNEYRHLLRDSRQIERRLIRNARDGRGFSPYEMRDTQMRIARLEQKIARDVRDGRRWAYRW